MKSILIALMVAFSWSQTTWASGNAFCNALDAASQEIRLLVDPTIDAESFSRGEARLKQHLFELHYMAATMTSEKMLAIQDSRCASALDRDQLLFLQQNVVNYNGVQAQVRTGVVLAGLGTIGTVVSGAANGLKFAFFRKLFPALSIVIPVGVAVGGYVLAFDHTSEPLARLRADQQAREILKFIETKQANMARQATLVSPR
jgi:hypothetical protein